MQTYSSAKRVNVISIVDVKDENGNVIPSGVIMRTTRSYADKLIAAGTHTHTSKGRLHSFLNKSTKLHRNGRVINKLDLKNKKLGHVIFTDEHSGKTYVAIKKGEHRVIMEHKTEINPHTGKPRQFPQMVPIFQLRVARYPTY